MKRKHLNKLTIALGTAMFLTGLSFSLSSFTAATSLETPQFCYDTVNQDSCPPQTTAKVTISGSSTETVAILPASSGGYTLTVSGQSITVPKSTSPTTVTITSTSGTVVTATVSIVDTYKVLCIERTSPGGGGCSAIDCMGHVLQTYTCPYGPGTNPGGTSTGTGN
jgi:hypothetical protein